MAVGRLTKRSVEAIPLPVKGSRSYLWDDQLKGFGCMVMPTGSRSYLVQYQLGGRGGKTQRATIGKHGAPWTADKARDRAADLLEMIRKGVDPVEEAKRQRETAAEGRKSAERLAFDAYAELFGKRYVDAKGLRSGDDIKSVLRRDLVPVFKSKPITAIRRGEIVECLDAISERSKSAAVKAHKWARKLFSWAVERGDLAASPMEGMGPPHRDNKRKRVLKGNELRAVWMAAEAVGEPYASFIKLLLLTGQRLREVAGATWSEIDLSRAEWVLPADRTKNQRDHLCPLSPLVVSLLETRFPKEGERKGLLFTTTGKVPIEGFSKLKQRVDKGVTDALAKIAGDDLPMMQPWTFHDLRRSFATGCQGLGFPIEHVEACLNHVSGKRGGLVEVYQLYEYQPEKVAVMAAWGRHVEALLAASASNIVDIRTARG